MPSSLLLLDDCGLFGDSGVLNWGSFEALDGPFSILVKGAIPLSICHNKTGKIVVVLLTALL